MFEEMPVCLANVLPMVTFLLWRAMPAMPRTAEAAAPVVTDEPR